jgi:hypothetical protein
MKTTVTYMTPEGREVFMNDLLLRNDFSRTTQIVLISKFDLNQFCTRLKLQPSIRQGQKFLVRKIWDHERQSGQVGHWSDLIGINPSEILELP